jgi:hypothetical protein
MSSIGTILITTLITITLLVLYFFLVPKTPGPAIQGPPGVSVTGERGPPGQSITGPPGESVPQISFNVSQASNGGANAQSFPPLAWTVISMPQVIAVQPVGSTAYNPVTSTFTVPVAGEYLFNARVDIGGARSYGLEISINNSNSNVPGIVNNFSPVVNSRELTATGLMNCQKGDNITVQIYNITNAAISIGGWGPGFSEFSGVLV